MCGGCPRSWWNNKNRWRHCSFEIHRPYKNDVKLNADGEVDCGSRKNKEMVVHDATEGRAAMVPSAKAGIVQEWASNKDPRWCSLVTKFFAEAERANAATRSLDKRARTKGDKSGFEATLGPEYFEQRRRPAAPPSPPKLCSGCSIFCAKPRGATP